MIRARLGVLALAMRALEYLESHLDSLRTANLYDWRFVLHLLERQRTATLKLSCPEFKALQEIRDRHVEH